MRDIYKDILLFKSYVTRKMAAQLLPVLLTAAKLRGKSTLAPFALLFTFRELAFLDKPPDLLAALASGLHDRHPARAFAFFHAPPC